MPFTPYHFGPSGFIGLTFKKWLDIPVFVLANVIVDVEVLIIVMFELGRPRHRYCHTLLIGAVVGAIWGLAAYPLRNLFKRIMQLLRIPYKTSLRKMLLSGALGACLHAVIDGFYHYDVRLFWPGRRRHLWRLTNHQQIEAICIAFLIAAVVLYVTIVIKSWKQTRIETRAEQKGDK
jgi:membrane-bound metal-dependent hydrolase YbcI (DUF457 family)